MEAAVPNVPMRPFAEAALAEGAGDSEAALRYLEEAAAILQQQGTSLEGVHLRLAGLLAQADRPADAEAAFRQEIQAFPNTVDAYTALARFYYATEREEAGDAALEALLQRVPTRDAYAAAARTWSALGERTQANRVRSEARARFRAAP